MTDDQFVKARARLLGKQSEEFGPPSDSSLRTDLPMPGSLTRARRRRRWTTISIVAVALVFGLLAALMKRNQPPPAPTVRRDTFERVHRAARAIQGATAVGVPYARFGELLQEFSTEIAIVKDNELNEIERLLVLRYEEALAHYKISASLWRIKLNASSESSKGEIPFTGDSLKDIAETYEIPVSNRGYWKSLPADSVQRVWQRAEKALDQATELYLGQ